MKSPTRNTGTRNDKKNNTKSCDSNKMWKDEVDLAQVSIGGGFRGVSIQETLDKGHIPMWRPKDGYKKTTNVSTQLNSGKKKAETKQQEIKMNETNDEIPSCAEYRNPILMNNFAKVAFGNGVKPAIYNRDFCVLDCPHSLLSANELKQAVVLKLNKLVSESFIDWDYESKYTFEGRIYKKNEDAGFRITIYLINEEKEKGEDGCVLEVRRNGGDSFLFHEFKSKFLGLMSDDKSIINYQKTGKFTMEGGFLSLLDDDDDVLLSESEDLLTPPSSSSSIVNYNNNFDANACVEEAINTKKYGVLRYRHCVAFLRNCSDNDIKLDKIMKVENVIDKLLIPIDGNDKIYDTLVIKSLLEVIYKIVCKDTSLASKDNRKAITNINREWSKKISHPCGNNFGKFFPSQQIQSISSKCIQQF